MKKIYSLIALVVMLFATVSINAQKYSLVSQAQDPECGVTYAVLNAEAQTYMSSKSASDGGSLLAQIVDDDCIWLLEATGEATPAGFDLYYLFNVGQNAYVQEVDLEGHAAEGYDGYDVFGYKGFNFDFGGKEGALKITIERGAAGEDSAEGEIWRTNGPSNGFVFARQNTVFWGDTEKFMKFGYQTANVAFEPYNEGVAWQLWTVRENTAVDKLQILVDVINDENMQFIVGTEPGKYTQATVDAWNDVLTRAQDALTTGADEATCAALFDELNAAYAAIKTSAIPVTEGYYYIVSGYDAFFEQQGTEKGIFGYSIDKPMWKDLDASDYSFLWKIEPKNDGWAVKNILYNTYLHGSTEAGTSKKMVFNAKSERTVYFESLGDAQWKIYNDFSSYGYHTESHSSGAGKQGDLVTWNTGAHNGSAWILRPVTDEEYINGAIKMQAQILLKDELKGLIQDAGTLYGQLFVVAADENNPLITEADDNAVWGEEGNQFLYNRQESSEGRYGALIDGIINTSEWGGGNKDGNDDWAYFHGSWSGGFIDVGAHSKDAVDFMQVDINKTPVSQFVLRYSRRYNNGQAQPTQMTIYATNDTTGFYDATDKWTKITTIYPTPTAAGQQYVEGTYTSPLIDLGAEYKYIRFTIDATNNAVRYATFSEFQLYPGSVSEELSQYYYAEGMKAAADKMETDRQAASTAYDENEVTQEMVDGLKADIAAVKALYASPDELEAAIALAGRELSVATQGEEFGMIKTEETINAYNAALAAASEIDLEGKLDKATLDAALKNIQDAQKAMYEDMVLPEAGKWYQITSQESTRETSSFGAYIYTDVKTGKLLWDTDEALAESATSMFQFIPVEGAEKPNTFYIQSMATGLYIGNQNINFSNVTYISEEPIPFQIAFIGGNSVAISSQKNNTNGTGLHTQIAGQSVVGWYYQLSDKEGNEASTWTFQEVDEELEGVVVPVLADATGALTLPFAVEGLADINEGISTYAVKNITTEDNTTTIELYAKDSFAAGEPMVYVSEGVDAILVPAPTTADIVTKAATANGLVGTLVNQTIAEGLGYFVAPDPEATEEQPIVAAAPAAGKAIAPVSGYINIATFTAAVDAETALTITAEGLKGVNPTSGYDVNEDGSVNVTDVVCIYNYIILGDESGIAKAKANVNGDDAVNVNDVVDTYNYIIVGEGGAKSPAYGTIVGDAQDPVVYVLVENTDDLTNIPVNIYLSNPDVTITALEACIALPTPLTVNNWVLDEDDEIAYETSARLTKSHGATINAGSAEHGPDHLYVSIASSKSADIKETAGEVITVYFDGSNLADDTYELDVKDVISVWTDKTSSKQFNTPDTKVKFTISGGKATAVESATAETIAAAKAVYTLDGKAVAAPQKGQIYVIDGKAVKY